MSSHSDLTEKFFSNLEKWSLTGDVGVQEVVPGIITMWSASAGSVTEN